MKKIIYLFVVTLSICSCDKTAIDDSTIVFQKINLTVPLNTTMAHAFKFTYTADVEFSFNKVGNTYTAQYKEYYGGYGFRCIGINDYVNRKNLNDLIVPSNLNNQANIFLEATLNGANVTYANTNNIKLYEDFYVPFCSYTNGINNLPISGWIRLKCTQTEMYIYDLAYRKTGEIKAGEK